MLNLIESFKILEKENLPVAKYLTIKSEADLKKLQYPCWLKASISEHKIEQGAVKKCSSIEEAKNNLESLRKKFPTNSIIAQEQVDGIEMIIGLKEDKVFGKLLMLGFGGTFTEIVKDVSFRALPISDSEIETSLKELKNYQVLFSRKKFAIDKFISLAERVASLDIKEADFNPVILNEKGAFIVDSRIEL